MSKKVDYSIEALLKNGGKVTGCMGFPWDPKVHTDPCKFCANFGNHSDGIFTLIVCHAVNEQGLRKVLDKFDKVIISNSYKDWDKIIKSDKLIVEKVW